MGQRKRTGANHLGPEVAYLHRLRRNPLIGFDSRRPHQSSFHHATVLTIAGDSYRLKAATRNQASRTPQEVPRQ